MLKAITSTASALLQSVATTASAVNEIAGTVESLAKTSHKVADKWGEHTLENISFDDDESTEEEATAATEPPKV